MPPRKKSPKKKKKKVDKTNREIPNFFLRSQARLEKGPHDSTHVVVDQTGITLTGATFDSEAYNQSESSSVDTEPDSETSDISNSQSLYLQLTSQSNSPTPVDKTTYSVKMAENLPNVHITEPVVSGLKDTLSAHNLEESQLAILKAIEAMSAMMDSNFKQLREEEKKRLVWEKDITLRVAANEKTLQDRALKILEVEKSIEFMDSVAKKANAMVNEVEQTFDNIDKHLQGERVLTVREFIRLEDRLDILEREHRAFNMRVQGLPIKKDSNLKQVVVDAFKRVFTGLEIKHIEYVAKVTKGDTPDTPDPADFAPDDETEQLETAQGKKKPQGPIVLVRFTDRYIRNKVFGLSRKNKDKLGSSIIVRDDMIKGDYNKWKLAKPQMQTAYASGKLSRCRNGNLLIESRKTKIEGVEDTATKLHKAVEEGRLNRPAKE